MVQKTTVQKTTPQFSTRALLLFVTWAAALLGVLQIHQYEGFFGHTICGPWGCGPPVSALIGYHGFWSLLIFPGISLLKRWLSAATAHRWGLALILVSVAGIAALLLLEGLNNSAAENYPLRWCLFRVVTFVDVPLLQIGLAGLWLRWRAGRELRRQANSEADGSAVMPVVSQPLEE